MAERYTGAVVARGPADDPRERLIDACIEVVSQQGFAEARIVDICLLAGLSTRTFYEVVGTKEGCVDAAVAARGHELLASAKAAFDATAGSWSRRIEVALDRLLVDLSVDEPLARLLFVEFQHAGPVAAMRLAALAEEAKRLFGPPEAPALPAMAARESAIVGMVLHPIGDYVARGKTSDLPELAPSVAYFLTLFLIGSDEALELARSNERPANGSSPRLPDARPFRPS
jgi:AcrR family transcriptional regulator